MDKHPDKVVLSQVGSFYELYFDQAVEYAPPMGLRVALKRAGKGKVHMAGFPLNSLPKYVEILVGEMHKSVVIVDQVERPYTEAANEMKFDRRVSRIISPGTLLDETLRDFQENNHILLINFTKHDFHSSAGAYEVKVGLAWADLGLGTFHSQETSMKKLLADVTRIAPKEIVIDERFERDIATSTRDEIQELQRYYTTYTKLSGGEVVLHYDNFAASRRELANHFQALARTECVAVAYLAAHLANILPHTRLNFELPTHEVSDDTVQIDARTSETLELVSSIRTRSAVGSLFSCIRRTVTQSGTRMLKAWMLAPSTQLDEIRYRQKLVAVFEACEFLRIRITGHLAQTHDLSRIVQSVSLDRSSPIDLVYLAHTLQYAAHIRDLLAACTTVKHGDAIIPLLQKLQVPEELAEDILNTVDEYALVQRINEERGEPDIEAPEEEIEQNEMRQWIIRPEHSHALTQAHARLAALSQTKQDLETELRASFNSVVFKCMPRYGHFVALRGTRGQIAALEDSLAAYDHSVVRAVLGNTVWVRLTPAVEIEENILRHVAEIEELEKEVLRQLRSVIEEKIPELRNLHHVLDYIDVTTSFAVLAHEKHLTRPKMTATRQLDIVGGRHLVVEEGLQTQLKEFTGNDCTLSPKDHLWVISGPNMGGKTTFLRQNAIIVLLAQMGSYVPATRATIGIVDKIFTRVGSGDDLFREMSTFMVEMVETSMILNGATKHSLAIMDEVGRGTSGKEGLAIAFATMVHLQEKNKCRTLFATHFAKELSDLLAQRGLAKGVSFYKTEVTELQPKRGPSHLLSFDHKLRKGVSENSYAINVAASAGFPKFGLKVAEEALHGFKARGVL
ncbi:hypothetical protein BABINDRAFT_169697 [Babjeviella inositovora NRRL Y-12698]|uniref:DNA mismatch repair proteins mutS family domain-containing protein n=1 Tax=Babjeviella inositovora NRRL Y-12698 TaxID=984486 RepID=A0A1E3QZ12_9ASCO|nr:uncharacterized protein BABINDRAFT_169697 [Babjeviella inositovora NRRL Y-12698]ODQ82322.1 hypothetical protein BABINDRAFT_169697 [Babjeviella inositovora NRRL Y-12698]